MTARTILCAIQLAVCLGCSSDDRASLEILGGPDCHGAEVLVDGESKGIMSHDNPDVAHLNLGLRTGKRVVEFRRAGFATETRVIDIPSGATEHYARCELEPTIEPRSGRSIDR